jgi:hypothetical protein
VSIDARTPSQRRQGWYLVIMESHARASVEKNSAW